MSTIGWIAIVGGLIIISAVVRGRVLNLGEDLSDAFLAIVSGDSKTLSEVVQRRGDSSVPSEFQPGAVIGSIAGNAASQVGDPVATNGSHPGIASAAIALGTAAKGYKYAGSGPDWYDCSGLMYRAVQRNGYSGGRFTTATILSNKSFLKISPMNAGVGDIVLWPSHHMGVLVATNKMYSARNSTDGIGYSTISGFRKEDPVYVRYNPSVSV